MSTAEKSNEVTSDFDAAAAAAVAEGLEAVDRLAKKVTAVLDRCVKTAEIAASDHGDQPGGDVIAAFAALLTARRSDAEHRFASQRTRLSAFNLILFGRTGAGKSSLIEALSSGDGKPISQGESDWTTDVRDVSWGSSRLVDTPGIGGWGRTRSLATLEARAEAAVADADVVILCFDTQSQQAGEFSKIAHWVSNYGKPVVAVLNSRNARWRQPVKVGRQSTRRDLSQTVLEHTGNIRDELGRIGLPDVPIIAIHAQRAAFARTTEPYTGPFPEVREKQRDEYGPERLLGWSNLPALELILSEALERHATPLRLGMLHEQAHAMLSNAKAAVQLQHDEASVLAKQLEGAIGDVLGLLGRPADKDLAKRLAGLEKLRGGFGTAGPGELFSHARYRLASALQRARAEAFRDADRLVDAAFETRDDLGPEDFERMVLAPAQVKAEAVARSVGAEMRDYLSQRLELVADDVRADLSAAIKAFEGADTTAGQSTRSLGLAFETGRGLLSIGGGVFFLAAVLGPWSPAGWTLAAVAAATFIGGFAASTIGGWFRKKAAVHRVSALSDARAEGRRAIRDTFGHLEQAIGEDFNRILSHAAHERLADDVAQATALRRVSSAGVVAVRDLQKAIDDVPEVANSSHLLSAVANDLQRRNLPGEPTAGRLLWLGESWCTDPEGLTDAEAEAEAPATTVIHDPADHARLLARIRSVTETIAGVPEVAAGAAWVTATLHELAGDDNALEALAPVQALVNGAPPRIVLAGDYSTGKSSFVKRLLVDSGQGTPEELDVAAQPKTASRDPARFFAGGDLKAVLV